MKKIVFTLIIFLVLSFSISAEETNLKDENKYLFLKNVAIESDVRRDVIFACININVDAGVGGALRGVCDNISISSLVSNGATVLAIKSFNLNSGGKIYNDVYVFAKDVVIDGDIYGNLNVTSETLKINGNVYGEINHKSNTKANVKGNYNFIDRNKETEKNAIGQFISSVSYILFVYILVVLLYLFHKSFINIFIEKFKFSKMIKMSFALILKISLFILLAICCFVLCLVHISFKIGLVLLFFAAAIIVLSCILMLFYAAFYIGNLIIKKDKTFLKINIGFLIISVLLSVCPLVKIFVGFSIWISILNGIIWAVMWFIFAGTAMRILKNKIIK